MNTDTQRHDDHPTVDPRTVDLQIVGGGLAGLVAANLAADAGLTVRVLERRGHAGGRAVTAAHHGYRLNLGPHALYLPGALRKALIDLDLDPPGAAPVLKGATGSIGGRVGRLPVGPATLLRTRLLSPGARKDLALIMARIPRLDATTLGRVTVDELLDDFTDRPDLRALLWGLTNLATYNAASDVASADAAVAQLQMSFKEGVIYVHDGWSTIVDRLRDRAERSGVEVRTGDGEVERVTGSEAAEGGPGTVVRTADGVSLGARATLVAAGSPAVTDRLLGLGDHYRRLAGPPVEASILDLGLRSAPPVGAHLGLDRGLYATLHSTASGLAPEGHHLACLARYRRPGDDVGPDETRRLLMAHGQEMGITPGAVVMDRYLHKLTVTWGMPTAEHGGLAGRPPVVVPDRPGLFVAGDWVGPRGLLADAAAASAADAVAAIVAARTGSATLVGS